MPPLSATDSPDAELAARVGDPLYGSVAFRALYDRHAVALLAFALARFPAVAEDVCQETWLRAHREWQKGDREMTNLRGWLFRIARNFGVDSIRSARAGTFAEGQDPPDPGGSVPLDGLLDAERRAVVARCIERLRPEFRAVIQAAAGGEPPGETAGRLGVTRANVDQRKSRGLVALRDCVERHLR